MPLVHRRQQQQFMVLDLSVLYVSQHYLLHCFEDVHHIH